ncbi:MRN complex-interacting protein isoform X4 [Macaca fascicularis]|uniref:MRN complex-interacting protein isoform X4 n=1 Tax=Macaca fascicularis TaxID=9541 RepID=UPI003D15E8D1
MRNSIHGLLQQGSHRHHRCGQAQGPGDGKQGRLQVVLTAGCWKLEVKKSVKWTCKACGEKQSFLRAYGEGSGADCRHHVQKLNLLQGQGSELPLRSLEETVSAGEEENMGHQQAGNVKQQEKSQPLESRWLKYLERDSQELELEGRGVCFSKQPSSKTEEPGPRLSQDPPRKRDRLA